MCDFFIFPAPLCPPPPDIPYEGVRDFVPNIFEVDTVKSCALVGEAVQLKCHTFLSVYIQTATFGREAANKKMVCDGQKENDRGFPSTDCLETSETLELARHACHGKSDCSVRADYLMADFTSCMPGSLLRELRTNHICGKLDVELINIAFHSSLLRKLGNHCLRSSHILPGFCSVGQQLGDTGSASNNGKEINPPMTILDALQEDESKKMLLVEKINQNLNSSMHNQVDLSLREISSSQGGLCGLAAIYQALKDTLLTKSQLRAMGYEELVEVMAEEMRMDLDDARKKSDAEMLMHLHDCEYATG